MWQAPAMAAILVTGANRGIGLELCRQLSERGDHVIAVCRQNSPELDQLGIRVEAGIDVRDGAQVTALATRLSDESIGILINNAGILRPDSLANLDFDVIRAQFEVNALGPLRVTAALLPRMRKPGKIIIITSRMGSIDDNSSGGNYGYRMSKAAVNMAGVSLARDLADRGIAVAILHPGAVRTEMTAGHGNVDVQDSVAGLLARIDELTMATSGQFWHANGEQLPW
jgi:NAD(P)-dependent dehydrogenase (short-subunit alcohol dehydrogenase family)